MVVKLLFTVVSPDPSCSKEHCASHSTRRSSTSRRERLHVQLDTATQKINSDCQRTSETIHLQATCPMGLKTVLNQTQADSPDYANLRAQNNFQNFHESSIELEETEDTDQEECAPCHEKKHECDPLVSRKLVCNVR